MRTKKIPNFDIKPPKKSAFSIDTPPDIPKLHTLMMLSGKRGGGKTVAISNFVRKLRDLDLMQRTIVITPTYNSNKEIWAPLQLDESTDVLEPIKGVLQQVVAEVEREKEEYERHLEKVKEYEEFKRKVGGSVSIDAIPPHLLLAYLESGFFDGPPKYKYPACIRNKHPPRVFVVIDDSMGTDLLKPGGGLVNFALKHRHIADGLGVSLAICCQSYSAQSGLNRAIRENLTALCLYKSAAQHGQQLEKIHEEIGADVDLEKFDRYFTYATSKPYGFLFVDFSPKTPEQQFRSGFDEYLIG